MQSTEISNVSFTTSVNCFLSSTRVCDIYCILWQWVPLFNYDLCGKRPFLGLFVCFKLTNCSLYWNHRASCVMKDSEKAFLIPFLSTVLDFMRLCHKAFRRLCLFQYENPKAVFSFLVQKPLHTFDHPVTMYFLFLPCPF